VSGVVVSCAALQVASQREILERRRPGGWRLKSRLGGGLRAAAKPACAGSGSPPDVMWSRSIA